MVEEEDRGGFAWSRDVGTAGTWPKTLDRLCVEHPSWFWALLSVSALSLLKSLSNGSAWR